MTDKAREKTDRLLRGLERRVKAVYSSDPSLLRIQKRYELYMDSVADACRVEYEAYQAETDVDERRKLKKIYGDKVKSLTLNSKTYRALVAEFTRIMANVNQQALDLVNAEMPEIYVLNYNQVAEVCKAIGIKVVKANG